MTRIKVIILVIIKVEEYIHQSKKVFTMTKKQLKVLLDYLNIITLITYSVLVILKYWIKDVNQQYLDFFKTLAPFCLLAYLSIKILSFQHNK
jgi:hypothetical protein